MRTCHRSTSSTSTPRGTTASSARRSARRTGARAWTGPDPASSTPRATTRSGSTEPGSSRTAWGAWRPSTAGPNCWRRSTSSAWFGRAEWSVGDRVLLTGGVRLNRETRRNDNFADNNGLVSNLNAGEDHLSQVLPSGSVAYSLTPSTSARGLVRPRLQGGRLRVRGLPRRGRGVRRGVHRQLRAVRPPSDGRRPADAERERLHHRLARAADPVHGRRRLPRVRRARRQRGEVGVARGRGRVGVLRQQRAEPVSPRSASPTRSSSTSCSDGDDLAGRAFPQSPAWNGAFGLGWRDPRGWFASGTFSYTDAAYTEIAAPVYTRVSSRRLLSGRAGYGRSGWSVYAWGANLLDDQYELARFDGRLFGLPGAYGRMADPRAVGAGVDFDW